MRHETHRQAADPHAGHNMSTMHGNNDRHAGHSFAIFRDKFKGLWSDGTGYF